jgi:hypothetical protein
MSDNKRVINLEPYRVAELLTEVARAHLHGGLPSTLLKRVKGGVDKFRTETKDEGERALASQFSTELEALIARWHEKEKRFYSM